MTAIDPSLFELFREEARAHAEALTAGLVELEADPTNPARIEPLMRAAHSLKGAARIVGIEPAVRLAHAMEDALVAAQTGRIRLTPTDGDTLLRGADVLAGLGTLTDAEAVQDWVDANEPEVARLEPVFLALAGGKTLPLPAAEPRPSGHRSPPSAPAPIPPAEPPPSVVPPVPDYIPVPIPTEPIPLTEEHGLLDLFREELRHHLTIISNGIEALASGANPPEDLADSLRQLRGSARLMALPPVAAAAAAMAAFLNGRHEPPSVGGRDWLRYAVHILTGAIDTDSETFPQWREAATPELECIAAVLSSIPHAPARPLVPASPELPEPPKPASPPPASVPPPVATKPPTASVTTANSEGVVRVTAQSLTRLMGLAGESLVQARWLQAFSIILNRLKKHHEILSDTLDSVQRAAEAGRPIEQVAEIASDARRRAIAFQEELLAGTDEFGNHASRAEDLNTRLYREVITSRMRPFADGVHGFPRLVRDMARSLGKQAHLVILGKTTEVDRDVLDRLEAPLNHLIRNAIDHGIEPSTDRVAAGKPEAGTVTVEARHHAGMLVITVADDGRGVNLDRLKEKIAERGLSTPDLLDRMSVAEVLEFLFLPGFTTAPTVTEYSGRGVGLDVVREDLRRIGGTVRLSTAQGEGATFRLQLPVTLSVIRAVVVEIGGEPYAFPHTRIDRLVRVEHENVRSIENRQFTVVDGQNVGLVFAGQILELPTLTPPAGELPVVLLSDQAGSYGLAVDRFRGEQDLVVRPLDPRLGRVPNVSSAAILDDGEPVLIVDADDLVRSMDRFIQTGSLQRHETRADQAIRKKRVLVVDDSITVREVERQLLLHKGYEVVTAVDGADGWNQVRGGRFDLLVTDVDMPRMNGLQLVEAVRGEAAIRELPTIIISYKERDEDRIRGMEAGANYYLTKSSFHDNRFIRAVEDLIGPATE